MLNFDVTFNHCDYFERNTPMWWTTRYVRLSYIGQETTHCTQPWSFSAASFRLKFTITGSTGPNRCLSNNVCSWCSDNSYRTRGHVSYLSSKLRWFLKCSLKRDSHCFGPTEQIKMFQQLSEMAVWQILLSEVRWQIVPDSKSSCSKGEVKLWVFLICDVQGMLMSSLLFFGFCHLLA